MADIEESIEMEYDILTLLDEDGQEHEFELVDSAELDGQEYMALIPIYENPEEVLEDSGELLVMRVAQEDGEQYLDAIDNEDEYVKVMDFFAERLSDVFEFMDEEDADAE